jgi:YHS domain-containing protein
MKQCENCEQPHNGIYGSGRFCNSKCARAFSTKNGRTEINKKISETLKLKVDANITCLQCGETVEKRGKKHQKFCSQSCASKFRYSPENNSNRMSELGKLSAISQGETRRSKNEIYFYKLCKDRFTNVLHNKPIFNGWDADIIIPELKIAILWNGKWHYEKITEKHSVAQVQNRDRIKQKEIETVGYTCYIIKDMGRANIQFVEDQFELFINSLN